MNERMYKRANERVKNRIINTAESTVRCALRASVVPFIISAVRVCFSFQHVHAINIQNTGNLSHLLCECVCFGCLCLDYCVTLVACTIYLLIYVKYAAIIGLCGWPIQRKLSIWSFSHFVSFSFPQMKKNQIIMIMFPMLQHHLRCVQFDFDSYNLNYSSQRQ